MRYYQLYYLNPWAGQLDGGGSSSDSDCVLIETPPCPDSSNGNPPDGTPPPTCVGHWDCVFIFIALFYTSDGNLWGFIGHLHLQFILFVSAFTSLEGFLRELLLQLQLVALVLHGLVG